jgi:hypothetical protein
MYTEFTSVGGVNLCYAIIVATCKRYYTKGEKNDNRYNHRKHIILFYFLYFFTLFYY